MGRARLDSNYKTTLIGVSSIDLQTPQEVTVNPVTGAMLIDGTSLHASLDTRYLMLDCSNDPITGDLTLTPTANSTTTFQVNQSDSTNVFNVDTTNARVEGVVKIDTKANLLASTPTNNALGFATDTDEFYLYNGTNWKVAPLELKTESATPDMGAYDRKQAGYLGLGVSDLMGYYNNWITDKSLSNVKLLQSVIAEEGSIRTTTSGVFQVYLNGVWNDVVINFRLREDSAGAYEFEHKPIGFEWWYEIMSGNSDLLDFDGRPIIQQYSSSMGAYSFPILLSGGNF